MEGLQGFDHCSLGYQIILMVPQKETSQSSGNGTHFLLNRDYGRKGVFMCNLSLTPFSRSVSMVRIMNHHCMLNITCLCSYSVHDSPHLPCKITWRLFGMAYQFWERAKQQDHTYGKSMWCSWVLGVLKESEMSLGASSRWHGNKWKQQKKVPGDSKWPFWVLSSWPFQGWNVTSIWVIKRSRMEESWLLSN